MSNPTKKRKSRRSDKRNPGIHVSSKRRSGRSRASRRSSHRNPSRSTGMKAGLTNTVLPLSGGVLVGTFVPRFVAQALLGANNTGFIGYGSQLVTSIVLGWLGGRTLNKNFGYGVIAGGVASTAYRIYQEHNPSTPTAIVAAATGQAPATMGDLDFSSGGLGIYVNQPFTFPQTNQFVNGQLVPAPAISAAALPAAQNMPPIPAQGTTQELDRYTRY